MWPAHGGAGCENRACLTRRGWCSSTKPALVRLRGRAPRGERLVDYAPQGHWKTITFVGGLRQRAMTAPFVLEGPINGPMFLAYVKQCLVPTLKHGEIVLD